jgi:membrane-associated phospholipid phosphatase
MKILVQNHKLSEKRTFLFNLIFTLIPLFGFHFSYSQDTIGRNISVYKLNPKVDIPLLTGCAAWCGYTVTQIYVKGPSTQAQILALNTNNIDPLDRWAVYPYNHKVDRASYYPFYASFPLPLVFLLFGKDTRSDFLKLTFLYMESLSVTAFLGSSATFFVNQYRPYTYSSGTTMTQKMKQNAKNSFYAGHVEIVGVSTFFIAQVYANYYPHSKAKWLIYALSGAATLGMGCLRIDAGMHFPSDVLLGAATGALTGLLVPYFHNHKISKNNSLKLSVY